MNSKKAQITLFVIVAIVIIAVVSLVYSTGIFQKLKDAGMPEQVNVIKQDIESCVKSSSKKSLGIISMQGGYLAPKNYYLDANLHVAYWRDNEDISPTIENIENELSDTTCISLINCIDFEKYNLRAGECSAKTTIKPDYVLINVNYPFTINTADKTYTFEDFSAKIDARLGKVYNVAKEIIAEHSQNPEEVCLTCLADIGEENNMLVKVGSDDDTLITTITDENSQVFDTAYEFRFAMK